MTADVKIDPATALPAGSAVVEESRSLVRVVAIDDVQPHPNADRLDIAYVGGWRCVTKRNEFRKGDLAIYCEIDSLLPLRHVELFGFLEARHSDNKLINGEAYHRLKSIRLRKELSQGLLVPLPKEYVDLPPETDLTAKLGVLKYEANPTIQQVSPVPEDGTLYRRFCNWLLRGLVTTLLPWPSMLVKSEQPRIQNRSVAFAHAKENQDAFEVTYKLEGSSMTVFCVDEAGARTGVCSRDGEIDLSTGKWSFVEQCRYWLAMFLLGNRRFFRLWRLRIPAWKTSNQDNSYFAQYEAAHRVRNRLKAHCFQTGEFITVQGELIGPNINKNFERVPALRYYVYAVYRDGNKRLLPEEARAVCKELHLNYVPVLNERFVIPPEATIQDILAMADGPAAFTNEPGTYREGLVFKCLTRPESFKVISNSYLLKAEA